MSEGGRSDWLGALVYGDAFDEAVRAFGKRHELREELNPGWICEALIVLGSPLAEVAKAPKLTPREVEELAAVAEKAGELRKALDKVRQSKGSSQQKLEARVRMDLPFDAWGLTDFRNQLARVEKAATPGKGRRPAWGANLDIFLSRLAREWRRCGGRELRLVGFVMFALGWIPKEVQPSKSTVEKALRKLLRPAPKKP